MKKKHYERPVIEVIRLEGELQILKPSAPRVFSGGDKGDVETEVVDFVDEGEEELIAP